MTPRGSSETRQDRVAVLRLQAGPMMEVLDKHQVEFIVIGGFAVNAHGVIRSTNDVDICPNPKPKNLRRLAAALEELEVYHFEIGDFKEEEMPYQPDYQGLSHGGNFILGSKYGRIDIMQWVDGVEGYEELNKNTVVRQFAGKTTRFSGYDELLKMKRAAARDKDLLDLQDLKAVHGR